MLKTLVLSASVFASGVALAQTTMTREPSTGRSVVTNPSSSLSTDHWHASDVYKADVYDPSEHKIGNVTDLIIDSNGNVTGAIIGVGGFIGISQKDVIKGAESLDRAMAMIGWPQYMAIAVILKEEKKAKK